MKNLLNVRLLFMGALLLILLVNAFILIGVGYNRSGEPSSMATLTEREVNIPYRWGREDTSLRLHWRVVSAEDDEYSRYSAPLWFDQKKLETLGFEFLDNVDNETSAHFIETEVILVLEYDGTAYQQVVSDVEARIAMIEKKLIHLKDDEDLMLSLQTAKDRLQHEELSASRLFVVDAGLDQASLRALYPDKSKYILAPGIVEARIYWPYDNGDDLLIAGRIDRLSVEYLHVAGDAYSSLKNLKVNSHYSSHESPPRFSLEVHYGQRLEPWIEKIEML